MNHGTSRGPLLYHELKRLCFVNRLLSSDRGGIIPQSVLETLADLSEEMWNEYFEAYRGHDKHQARLSASDVPALAHIVGLYIYQSA